MSTNHRATSQDSSDDARADHSFDLLVVGKRMSRLNPFSAPEADAYFANERVDEILLSDKKLNHCVFFGIGFKGAQLARIDFSHSLFIRCYFRGAALKDCNFTGCSFVDCKFPNAALTTCRLQYTEWKNTSISVDEILGNIPSEPNLAGALLESLRRNATSQWDGREARRLLFAGMKCSQDHFWRVAFAGNRYYRDKYRGIERWKGLAQFLGLKSEALLWGFGELPLRLLAWAILAIVGFGVVYLALAPEVFKGLALSGLRGSPLWRALQFSALTFSGSSPAASPADSLRNLSAVMTMESLGGIVFIGVLAAAAYRRISVRQGR